MTQKEQKLSNFNNFISKLKIGDILIYKSIKGIIFYKEIILKIIKENDNEIEINTFSLFDYNKIYQNFFSKMYIDHINYKNFEVINANEINKQP